MEPCSDILLFQFGHKIIPAETGFVRIQANDEEVPGMPCGIGRDRKRQDLINPGEEFPVFHGEIFPLSVEFIDTVQLSQT